MFYQTEADLKRQICQYLEAIGVYFWIEQAGKIPGRINKSRYLKNGISDLLGVFLGKMLAIEVKLPTGKVSKEQQEFIDEINKHGGIAFVARSLEEVIVTLSTYRKALQSTQDLKS